MYLQTNQPRTIRSLNPIFMIGFFLVLLVVRTTGYFLAPTLLVQWDILLPFMIYFGQRRPIFEGLLLWFFLAHIYSLQSVAPVGLFVVYYLIIFLASRLTSEVFYATSSGAVLGLIALVALISRFVLPLVAQGFQSGWSVFSWRNLHPGTFLINTFLGWICYFVLGAIDKISGKDSRQILDLHEGIV